MRLSAFFYADLFFRLADRLIARLANSFDNLAERAVVGAHGFEALTGDFTGIADDDERIGIFLADDLTDAEHFKSGARRRRAPRRPASNSRCGT